ncbi:eukaryotic rRNA processing [Parasitella parasitica]|nr:eukaryotic rRNA processing [Parasitella parasitica]
MAPQNQKAKLDHTPATEMAGVGKDTVKEDAEPVWIRLEDLDEDDIDDEYGDMVIEQRILVNNEDALERITDDIRLKNMPWIETLTVTSEEPVQVADVYDDLLREEAFYKQALNAALVGRKLAEEAGVAFFRPENFIAPMLKDDKQMEAVRQRLIAEAKDGDEDALRRLQIFNKEQKKAKSNERIKLLSRKRKDGAEVTLDDEFNVDLEEAERLAAATNNGKSRDDRPAKNYDRDSKDAKYSLGKRKKGTNTIANPAKKGMSLDKKSSVKRPGKAKRQMMRGRS